MFDVEALSILYSDLSALDGMNVADFQKRLKNLFAKDRSNADLNDYRLGKKPWKGLADEIVPVSHFLQFQNIGVDRIRFPRDNNTPDCWLLNDKGQKFGIEVTIARGRERFELTKEMNETGIGRGFIGLQDVASQADFDKRMSNPRNMFDSEQALQATKAGILFSLSKKNSERYENIYYLVIQAHLSILPNDRWSAIAEDLSQKAAFLPFQEIHVIGDVGENPWGFQIK
jgi:hypothetical protein